MCHMFNIVTMIKVFSIAAVLLIGFFNSASATRFVAPSDQVVKSPNGQFHLHINATSGLHELREGTKFLWSFQRNVWHHDYFVSNDGKHVMWLSWRFVKADDLETEALTVHSSVGVALKKTFAELGTPRPYKNDEIGPIGDFWRIWRGEVTRKGEVISIAVEGREKPIEIDFSEIEESRRAE